MGTEKATRLLDLLLLQSKEYVALMHLHKDVEEKDIRAAFEKFKGTIVQLPPVRSHVKRVPRERMIYELEIIEIKERDVLFRASVQSGTYIRKLTHDIGQYLGVGAHMTELRRTRVANILEGERSATLEDLEDAVYFYQQGKSKFLDYILINPEEVFVYLPWVWIKDSAVNAICLGAKLAYGGIVKANEFKQNDWVIIATLKNEMVAVGKAIVSFEEMMKTKKGQIIKPDRVLMKPNTYPDFRKGAVV